MRDVRCSTQMPLRAYVRHRRYLVEVVTHAWAPYVCLEMARHRTINARTQPSWTKVATRMLKFHPRDALGWLSRFLGRTGLHQLCTFALASHTGSHELVADGTSPLDLTGPSFTIIRKEFLVHAQSSERGLSAPLCNSKHSPVHFLAFRLHQATGGLVIDGGRGYTPTHQAFDSTTYVSTLFGASALIPSGGFRGIICYFRPLFTEDISTLQMVAQGLSYQTSDLEN